MTKKKYKFEIFENPEMGKIIPVVKGEANTKEEAERECMHYAMQYAQDCPILIRKNWIDSETNEEDLE